MLILNYCSCISKIVSRACMHACVVEDLKRVYIVVDFVVVQRSTSMCIGIIKLVFVRFLFSPLVLLVDIKEHILGITKNAI